MIELDINGTTHRLEVEGHLARDKQQVSGANGLGVGTNRRGSVLCVDGGPHQALMVRGREARRSRQLGRFCDLVGADAASADAHTFDAAVDDGPNGLDVRLESARSHVVCVANVSTKGRALTANLATLRHGFALSVGPSTTL